MLAGSGLSTRGDGVEAAREATAAALGGLGGAAATLAVLFVSTAHVEVAPDVLAAVNEIARPAGLVGCVAESVLSGVREVERSPGVAVWLAALPELAPTFHLEFHRTDSGGVLGGWTFRREGTEAGVHLLIADPYTFPADSLLDGLNDLETRPAIVGGMASGASSVIPEMRAFFAPTRNFFTGALTPGIGKFAIVPKFYSAALLPRDKYTLWLFAATDGQVHMVDGVSDQIARLGWGSDLASVRTACGAGWQILATSSGGEDQDSIRAYEFPDRDPVAVSAPADFSGAITALWSEAKGDTAVAIAHNREAGSYGAFRVALSCNK